MMQIYNRKFIFATILITSFNSFCLADLTDITLQTNPQKYYNDIFKSLIGSGTKNKKQEINHKKKIDTYTDTVIFEDIRQYNNKNVLIVYSNVDDIAIDNIKNNAKSKIKKKKIKRKIVKFFVGGYCSSKNDISVTFTNQYGFLTCDLDFGKDIGFKQVELYVGYYPDYKREMLIALPIYATVKENNKKIYFTAKGFVQKADKTSLNVADNVKTYYIRKLLDKSLLVTTEIAYNQAMLYMNDIRNYGETEMAYLNNQNGNNSAPVVVTNKKVPKPKKKQPTKAKNQ